jgi:hypothetical protein
MADHPALERTDIPLAAIASFCQQWGIAELAFFGSVLREDFNAESDIDLLATFRSDVRYTLFDLTTMIDELSALFGRPVDLLDRRALEESENYIRRKVILGSAEVFYAE